MKKKKDTAIGNVKPDPSRNLPAADPLSEVIYDPYIIDDLVQLRGTSGAGISDELEEIIDEPVEEDPDGPRIPDFPCLDTAKVLGHEVTSSFRGFVYRPEVTLLIQEVEGATDYAVRIKKVS